MASLVPSPARIALAISCGEGGSGDLTGGNTDLWNVNNSFIHDIISITFYRKKKKIVSTRYLFVCLRVFVVAWVDQSMALHPCFICRRDS